MQDDIDLAEALADSLAAVLGTVEVRDLTRLTGGASRETWAFDAVGAGGTRTQLVLRRDPPGRPGPAGSMALEAAAMRLADAVGMAVPEVLLDVDDPAVWGSSGLIMRRVDGEALGRRILRDEQFEHARVALVEQSATALARLHSIDPSELPAATELEPLGTMRSLLDGFGEPVPTFEYALAWLERRRPEPTGRAIVHGDFRLGNLLVDPAGLTAVLDWELLHVGDPAEDLGWFCVRAWRFGAAAPVAGLGEREELLAAYAAAGGVAVDLSTLRWWEAYGTLRWGIICLNQAAAHLSGAVRSVELAAIGRRVCETEWDLLGLLAPEAAASAATRRDEDAGDAPVTAASPPGLHGRPTSLELVEAVREFLEAQMATASRSASYHARVAANALGIVERELARGAAPLERRALALASLGLSSERDLADAIRAGRWALDDAQLLAVLADGVLERVGVANPRYLSPS
ncbi:MAG: phosphotransferase family protein [Microthrixaceae bacterium]